MERIKGVACSYIRLTLIDKNNCQCQASLRDRLFFLDLDTQSNAGKRLHISNGRTVMDEKFLFRQGTTYEFKVGVPIVQDSDKHSITIATTKTKQIEKGKYKLKVLFQLLCANDSPVNRQFESEEIDIELI